MAGALSSPTVRIGVLRHRDVIRCRLQGRHRLEDAQGHTLAILEAGAGLISFRPRNAESAQVRWRSVLCKAPTREAAEAFRADLPDPGPDRAWETEIVGSVWPTPDGGDLDSREWWVHSPAFESVEECRAWCYERGLSTLVIGPMIRRPPQGQITCRGAGITTAGLEVGGLFRLVPGEPRGSRIGLEGVIVGIDFHWQHLETQWLRGTLEILLDLKGQLTAVNELSLEEYLMSVVGSEMRAEMPHELLKVQAVCARNTYLATAGKHHRGEPFAICNDDHCQCYRGSTRETRESREAVVSTWGEVLTAGGRLCDTRYAKICGGVTEAAHSVWGGPEIPYMTPVSDSPSDAPDLVTPPIDSEERARAHIASSPLAFCNCRDREVPDYLNYAGKYFRWEIRHSREELEELLNRFPEGRVGELRELVARVRGASGRIEELVVVGSEGEGTLRPELHIRQALSESTLYSSCFVVEHERDDSGRLTAVTLRGAGWGHGAGMCQVGATVMALENYTHEQILTHYYCGAALDLVYDQPTNWAAILESLDDGDFSSHDRCWEATNCYEVVGCPIYETLVGPDKGYLEGAVRTKMYLDCPKYHRQTAEQPQSK